MNRKINDQIFNCFPQVESNRLIYREFRKDDVSDLFLIRSDDKVMNFMDTKKHQTVKDSEKFINGINDSFNNKEGINWVIVNKSTNELIGYFGFWRLIKNHCRAEIGYALKPEFWGKGLMKETVITLINFGFNKLKLHSIEANVNPENESSIQLLLKVGFKQEAYFREDFLFENNFKDSMIFSLLERDLK